jgi:flagellar basal body P-ring formation protein FlgA
MKGGLALTVTARSAVSLIPQRGTPLAQSPPQMNTLRTDDRNMTLHRATRGVAPWLALACLGLCAPGHAEAPALEPLADIASAAKAFVTAQIRTQDAASQKTVVTVNTLDPRLRLPLCSHAPEAVPAAAFKPAPRMTVGVRCQQPLWTVYVSVSIESELEVLVLRQSAAAGASLGIQDVETQTRRAAGSGTGLLTDAKQLAGRHLRATAAAGTALTVELLVPDILIKRGQRVTLVAAAGTLEVRAQGEAVADATATGRVRVLNLNSRKIVEGQVESADQVRISL